MTISLAWKGYGSAIFIELGTLQIDKQLRQGNGEISIWLEWDWRVEKYGKILFGSSNSRPEIIKGINKLTGNKIKNIEISGEIPELTIYLSGGYRIQTMSMVEGDPRWTIRQKDSTCLFWKNSKAVESIDVANPITEEERIYQHFIEKISEKLGRPIIEPMIGKCNNCTYFFSIDGDFELLDYGVCLNDNSELMHKIVKTDSGCPVFCNDE